MTEVSLRTLETAHLLHGAGRVHTLGIAEIHPLLNRSQLGLVNIVDEVLHRHLNSVLSCLSHD